MFMSRYCRCCTKSCPAWRQILPYRPEPWVHLAKLYRLENGDTQKCFNYASAALAQGNARQEALFLNTNVSMQHAGCAETKQWLQQRLGLLHVFISALDNMLPC